MNKLDDMSGVAAKLAAQEGADSDILKWHERLLSQSMSDWMDAELNGVGSTVLIDIPADSLAKRARSAGETTLIWSGLSTLLNPVIPSDWRFSKRIPTNLSQSDSSLLSAAKLANTPYEIQQVFAGDQNIEVSANGRKELWIENGVVDHMVAPFIVNSLQSSHLSLALKELVRVLSKNGAFKTTVLLADQVLTGQNVDLLSYRLQQFPQENQLSSILESAGLHGITFTPMLQEPVLTVNGVELRAFAVSAYTGTKGVCLDQKDAALYLGPWSQVCDDDGHVYPRGVRIAVCAKTAAVLQKPPYAGSFAIVQAYDRPDLADAPLFDCSQDVIRTVAETKGAVVSGVKVVEENCGSGCDC